MVQLASGLDKERNRRRAAEAVARAAGSGAGLVVLPEAAMCGFAGPATPLWPLAEPLDGPFVTALHEVAVRTRVTVVAGMFEAIAPAGGARPEVAGPRRPEPGGPERVYNTVVAVAPDGLRAVYRKLHLYDALGWCESDRVAPGPMGSDALALPVVGGLTLGLLTCYDLRFPELARALAVAGATVLVVPAAWVAGPAKREQWCVLLRARAIENTAYVLAAAQPAPEYSGHSAVVDPAGSVLAEADAEADGPRAGLVRAEVRAERVAEVRTGMPVLEHRRFDVLARNGEAGSPGRPT